MQLAVGPEEDPGTAGCCSCQLERDREWLCRGCFGGHCISGQVGGR